MYTAERAVEFSHIRLIKEYGKTRYPTQMAHAQTYVGKSQAQILIIIALTLYEQFFQTGHECKIS